MVASDPQICYRPNTNRMLCWHKATTTDHYSEVKLWFWTCGYYFFASGKVCRENAKILSKALCTILTRHKKTKNSILYNRINSPSQDTTALLLNVFWRGIHQLLVINTWWLASPCKTTAKVKAHLLSTPHYLTNYWTQRVQSTQNLAVWSIQSTSQTH
jgi:hypothetical protein